MQCIDRSYRYKFFEMSSPCILYLVHLCPGTLEPQSPDVPLIRVPFPSPACSTASAAAFAANHFSPFNLVVVVVTAAAAAALCVVFAFFFVRPLQKQQRACAGWGQGRAPRAAEETACVRPFRRLSRSNGSGGGGEEEQIMTPVKKCLRRGRGQNRRS